MRRPGDGLMGRVRGMLADRSDTAVAKKVAGGAFLFRVGNAAIAFASQILLARWMGEGEYGVYVYVWTWVLLLGGMTSLGLASAPQRFIPEYAESGETRLLRGFLLGSRLLAVFFATVITAIGLLGLWAFGDHLESWTIVPLYLGLFCVPMYVLTDVQDGVARTHNWIDVALAPAYLVRPLLILGLLGVLSYQHFAPTAVTAMAATLIATWLTAVAQLVLLERRLATIVDRGPRDYAAKTWMKVSLPIFMVEGFYLLLAYTDVLVLSAFRPPEEVGVYYACVKVMSLVAFVSFSVSAAVAHRFTEYSVSGDRVSLERMVRDAARWTFWPSLVGCAGLLAFGWPMLWLFGPAFTVGYPLLFVIAIGLLARATVGPLERLLNMLGQQNLCAAVYGGAFALNLALAVALVPSLGMMGAAVATAITLTIESALLYWVSRARLGLGALPWSPAPGGGREASARNAVAAADAVASPLPGLLAPDMVAEPQGAVAPDFELVDIEGLAERRAAWDDLVARAVEPNLFCEPDFALPCARRLRSVRRVRFALAWETDASGVRRLVAMAALERRTVLPFVDMRSSTRWAFFGAYGVPLLDGDAPAAAAAALLDGLSKSGCPLLQLRFLPENGAAAAAVRDAVARTGRSSVVVDRHARAMLAPASDAETYLSDSLSSKKLKELRRQLRRLGDDAPVVFREHRAPADVMAALERFVELEALGWKGAAGSAMKLNPNQGAFIRELFAARAARGQARVLELTVGDAPAAIGLVLQSGRQAWFYKIAYDERWSRCSPGVQLTIELTKRLIEDPDLDWVDSTAIADHPMIDHVWRERLALCDWMIATTPGSAPLLTAIAARADHLRRHMHGVAHDLYHRVKEKIR